LSLNGTHLCVITAGALSLRSGNPVLGQFEKLIPHTQVICQSSKPHALISVAHAFFVGAQWIAADAHSRERQWLPARRAEDNLLLAQINVNVVDGFSCRPPLRDTLHCE
jgi:hypothetical protein